MSIETQMNANGYVKVSGMAIINDVAVTTVSNGVLSPTLSNQKCVDCFNNECWDGWQLYRLSVKS